MEDIRMHAELLSTDPMVNLQNLSHEDPLISPISVEDITNAIKRIKNKAPGLSLIRKTELLQLPNKPEKFRPISLLPGTLIKLLHDFLMDRKA